MELYKVCIIMTPDDLDLFYGKVSLGHKSQITVERLQDHQFSGYSLFSVPICSWVLLIENKSKIYPLNQKIWEGTSRQRSGKGAIRKRFPLQKPRWEKTKLTIRYLYHETIVSRMGSYFPNRWPLSYLNLTKNMKTYIRRQQHKKISKHQDTKQKEPPQKHRPGTISNTKLLGAYLNNTIIFKRE